MASTRRLAAIMFTDIVGFTALAQANEEQALRLLEEHRRLLRPEFVRYHGTEVKTVGDGFLVRFDSALEATNSAIGIQERLFERNQGTNVIPLRVRIGVHLGDIVEEGGDVLGDAVNIASRIEPLADASGICITGPVLEQVGNKIRYRCTLLEHTLLKNVESPLTVYAIELPWNSLPAARITPWVDRVRELGHLEPVISDAVHGHGSVIAVSGEAGVGKTRFAEELLRRAKRSGATILRGRAFQHGSNAPYSLWSEIVREFSRDAPTLLLYKVCSVCLKEVATLAPDLAERLGPVPPRAEEPSAAGQVRFFEGVETFFRNVAREVPLALLLDDLQWADSGSIQLLEFLSRRIEGQRLLVVATYRDLETEVPETLRETISEMNRRRALVPMHLERLGRENGAELVRAILSAERATPDLETQVLERTGGNPFFVEEVLRSLLEEGQLVRHADGWMLRAGAKVVIPPTVGEVLRRRLGHLEGDAEETLRTGSVLGSEFTFGLLQSVTGTDEERLLHLVEQLLRSRLLREREIVPGRSVYDFGDEQIREILYQDLSLVRRQRLHLKAAEALARGDPSRVEETADEISRHYLLGGNLERAREFSARAARRAQALYSHDAAIRSWTQTLEILQDAPQDELRVAALLALGEEQIAVLKPDAAAKSWGEALQIVVRLGQRRQQADVHRRLGYLYRQYFQQNDRALDELERARAILEGEAESAELAQVYGDLADLLWYDARVGEAAAMCEKALAIASRTGAHDTEGWVYLLLANMARPEEKDRLFEYLERMLQIGVEHQLPEVRVGAIQNLSIAYLEVRGDWRAAERLLWEGVDYARSVHSLSSEMTLRTRFLPLVLIFGGELERANALAREMMEYMARFSPTPEPLPLFILGRVDAIRGKFASAEEHLLRALSILDAAPDWTVRMLCLEALAQAYRAQGNREGAGARLRECADEARKAGDSAIFGQHYCQILADRVAFALDQSPASAEVPGWVSELESLANRMDTDPTRAHLEQARGLSLWKSGRAIEGARTLDRAAQLFSKIDWPVHVATVHDQLAEVYREVGDPEKSEQHRASAQAIWASLGVSVPAGS